MIYARYTHGFVRSTELQEQVPKYKEDWLRGKRSIWSTSGCFAWQVQHLEHLRFVLRGSCSTWTTFIEVRGSPVTIDYFGRHLVLCGRRSTWSTSGSFCVAGAALGAPPARFAWQVQHLEHLRLVLRGRRSTWSTSGSFCVAGGASPVRFPWQA